MSTAGFHITEVCAEVYLQNESGMEFLQLARRLHDYLQQGQRLPARSLFEATDDCKEISREAFDALAKRRMENTGEISGVFELDFDARTLSALNIMDGWKVYAMQDVANAAEQAFQEAEISEDDRWRIFLDRLDGRELTTPSRLTARNFYFEDNIEAMDDRILNFYVVPCFNVDEVFGTFVETDENDHALNIYANYDMQRQQVCDTLEITLYGSGIEDQSLTYHLNAAEKDVLREKMDAYCMQREHKPLEQLCQELRRYTVFRLLPDDCYDAFFSVIREITGQFSLFPPEEHSLSEDDQTKLLSASAEEFFQSDDGDSDPEISLGLLDLFRRREGSEEKGELFYYEMFRLLGACEDTWSAYKKYIDRYMMYLHDIRAFVPTIRNFIKFILSTLTTNGPESYAAALYGFYNDDRTAEKLIVNPITYHGDCYRRHDEYMLSYVPRELPDGSMAICQEHVTDSLQALMKADYMLALNSGHNIRRCIICGKYFMLKSGVHALYCEGACPHAPGYTCRQFGTVEVQKELAKNNPKVKAKLTAFSRITKDMQRGAISQEDARRAKDHVRDRLYDALRSPDISVEEFSEQISTAQVYEYCRITRVSKPRGRPPKAKAGGTHDQ